MSWMPVEQNEILIGGIADADKKGEKRGKRRGGNFFTKKIHFDNASQFISSHRYHHIRSTTCQSKQVDRTVLKSCIIFWSHLSIDAVSTRIDIHGRPISILYMDCTVPRNNHYLIQRRTHHFLIVTWSKRFCDCYCQIIHP